jgi:3',5'-cyclic AMP phosphodiesterase CpdA
MDAVIADVNAVRPDLVVVGGDLTASGFLDEFEQAREYIGRIECTDVVTIPGNHDASNVGWVHCERLFCATFSAQTFAIGAASGSEPNDRIRIVTADSTRPDVNQGEIGRSRYEWIAESFEGEFRHKIFVLHHHLLAIPGTGRELSVVLDGGDVMWALARAGVDVVLSGHKHAPWVWDVGRGLVITSGTAGTWRTRGEIPPSYNIIKFDEDEVEITFRNVVDRPDTVQVFSGSGRRRRVAGAPPVWAGE